MTRRIGARSTTQAARSAVGEALGSPEAGGAPGVGPLFWHGSPWVPEGRTAPRYALAFKFLIVFVSVAAVAGRRMP